MEDGCPHAGGSNEPEQRALPKAAPRRLAPTLVHSTQTPAGNKTSPKDEDPAHAGSKAPVHASSKAPAPSCSPCSSHCTVILVCVFCWGSMVIFCLFVGPHAISFVLFINKEKYEILHLYLCPLAPICGTCMSSEAQSKGDFGLFY